MCVACVCIVAEADIGRCQGADLQAGQEGPHTLPDRSAYIICHASYFVIKEISFILLYYKS